MTLSIWLKQERAVRNISRKTAAEMIGIAPSQYSNMESGKTTPQIKTLEKIARAFDKQLEELQNLAFTQENDTPIVETITQEEESQEVKPSVFEIEAPSRIAILEAKIDYAIKLLEILTSK